ncbi:serine/arginine repetitive matrix protein 2-like isoform X1 [Penaeus indicus]|uniref:serine/arginine repetitive matrix protein 2-like isoform X1 n=1 Tax=Penaeus indicus TaxID=29960 RepID=UPI00300D88A4
MDTASIDSFWSESRVDSSWLGRSELRRLDSRDPAPVLDLDALQVALTRLDHSYQKGKASVGRSGALSHRRPPSRGSRGSRRSSADSLHLLLDQQDVEEDLVVPRVVNIEVQLENSGKEEEDTQKKSRIEDDPPSASRKSEARPSFSEEKNEAPTPSSAKAEEDRAWEGSCCSSVDHRSEIRRRLFESRHRRSGALVGGSNPLLNHFSSEAEESYRRIKEEVTRLAAKRRSSSDISGSRPPSESEATHDHKQQLRRWSEERDSSFLESASVTLGREGEDNRSSSEADVVISDRESIADSGLVNRRTVITINEKKSKSATSLTPEDSTPLWIRDLQTRRSLRLGGKDEAASSSRVIPIHIDPDFDGGINVSIVSQPDPSRRDSTSRMYVRQSDSENRPSRASAFNVRRTIEKRQIQQERRERKALREQIREQLRSLSEGRERKDSSGSHGSSVHLSQNSVRSKSMSSLDQDDDFRSESPLFKVQSSPTLEKEKEGVRSYLFGVTNLTESGESSCAGIPKTKEEPKVIRRERDNTECGSGECKEVQERPKTYAFERPDLWQWTQSWDSLKTAQQEVRETKARSVSKSVDSVQGSNKESSRLSCQESVSSLRNSKRDKKIKKAGKTEQKVPNRITDAKDPPEADCSFISPRKESERCEKESLASVEQLDPPDASARPVPPPRRKKLSLSAGHITLEAEEKPNWIRLAKERRSLRSTRQVEDLSDRASTTASKEPEWVARARKKLEALNVTLTSTTDFNSVSSHVTESSSAWSRGGLDALDDLREETSRIGEELAGEASARVNEDLGIKDSSRMIEHNTERSREPSAERPRVSFDASSVDASETADSSRRYRTRKSQKDEVRFGDLKHDWGGVQSKSSKNTGGKQKEMRFGEIQVKETLQEPPSPEKSKEMRFGDHMKSQPSQKTQNHSSSASGTRPVMRFGDTPLNLFPAPEAKVNQNSSKFESIAGPDPTKMTAEQLNQNVEEYDFPIPTGKEDASELMRFLEESLRKTEVVPEVVTVDDHRPKPKSILKRRSVENVLHELKREEKCEWLQKVEHRKSASFDWDSVGKGAEASLDTGHTRHSGSHHKPSRDHHSQHPIDLMNNNSSNNNFNNFHNKQLHDNLTTTTAPTMATNGSFFNVKLRHVSSNKREQPSLTNDHTLRFHLEQLQYRRSHSTADTHAEDMGDVPCRPSQGQRGIRRGSRGGDSHGSSSASSQESLSDTGGGGGGEGGRAVGHYRTGEEEEEEEGRREEKREEVRRRSSSRSSLQVLENGKARRDRSRAEAKRDRDFKRCEKEEKEEQMEGKRDTRLREVLHRVSDPPASSWGSCRTGRSFSATELHESVQVSSESSLVSRPDQEDHLSTSLQEDCSQRKDRISETANEITNEKNTGSEPSPNNHASDVPDSTQKSSDPHSLEASVPAVLNPPVEEEDDSRNEGPKSEGVPPREVINIGSQQGLTTQKNTPHKTYIASYHLTSLSSYKSFPDAPTASSPAPGEQGDSPAQTPKERRSSGADKEVQSSGTFVSQHTMEIQGAKSPAKVFSFTFSPAQATRPETVLEDFEGPSIIPASVREEVEVEKEEVGEEEEREEEVSRKVQETVHRSDGRRVFTIVTNPNDVRKNSEKINASVSSAAEGSSSKSRNIKINIQNEKMASSKSPEIPAKPSWMKLVTQNLSNSSERRRSEDKVHDGSSSKMKVQQVTVEVVDDEEPRKRRSAKEDERRRSSLMEWEALQRQRLEDEERNRINKNLSMKPVSTKIKELVKMHGSFMSMFSKDKKTDINGTVDGKDDIVFRKVTSENSSYELNNEAVKDTTVPMKSPYIVRKLLSPLKPPSPQEVTPPQRVSRKDATKGTSSSHKSPRVSRRDNSKSRLAEGRRDASPHKSVSENNRESVSINGHHRHASSSPSSRYRKTSTKDSSLESTSRSRDRESSTRSSRVSQSPCRNPEVKARHKDAAHTPKSPRKASASVDLEEKSRTHPSSKEGRVKELKSQREEYDMNGEVSESSNSFSYERRRSEGRSSIKDPQKRKEWLNRMLNTISSDHLAVLEDKDQMSSENHLQPPPSPRKIHDRQLDVKDVPSAELKDSASLDPPAPSSPAPTPPARKSSSKGLSADPLTSTPNKPKFTSSYLSSHPLSSSPLTPIKPAVPSKPASVSLSKPSVVASDVPTSSAKLSPSLPDTPSSLRSSLRDTLQSDSSNRRGPVSLSSILGDQSSRSSSRTSTPLTSPRATPERVIKKDSLDQVPKLDVIPESSLRSLASKAPESVGKATESVLRSPELALKAPESVLRASEAALRTAETFTSATETTLRTTDLDLKAPESVLRASDSRTPESVSRASESVPRASEVVSRTSDSLLRLSGRRSDPSCGEDQKENIAPSPSPVRGTDAKANKVSEEGRTSSNFSPSSYRSSFRLRERSEERREEDKKVSAKNNANSSWRPTSYKPFTFGKPSVTLKAMTTGVDPQRVSTSKNSNTKREQRTDTFTSQNLHTETVSEETKATNRKTSRTETNLSSPEKREDQISKRFSAERKSLRSRISTNDLKTQKTENTTTKTYDDKASSSQGTSSSFTRYSKDRTSLRSRELSERSTPDRDSSGPVSLSSILTRDVAPRTSTDEEPRDFQFKPNLSFSDELNDITLKYRKDLTTRRPSSDATHDDDDDDDVFSRNDPTRGSSVEPESKEPSPARETKPKGRERRTSKDGATHTPGRASKESSPAPKGLPKSSSSSGSSSRPKTTKLVRRNSSLKRSRPEEAGATSRTTAKKERKDSEDDPADLKSESIVQDPSGWTKTKTTVRRARLGSFEKTRQIARTSSGRNKKEKTFKMDASKQLEEWAAGTKVQGKLMKKEGQRFSHETEEEVKGGQRTSKSVVRRVVRRGSRRLSGGGELLTETKETSSAGAKKDGPSDKPDAQTRSKGDEDGGQQLVALPSDDGLSRKMKTSTDGERYMTQSVSSKDGKTTFTTEGVNNKTTNSVEVIGGEDFEAKRHVQGKTGHRVVVESSNDNAGRPSTVVKKVTSQSRVVITKTKRKIPVVV